MNGIQKQTVEEVINVHCPAQGNTSCFTQKLILSSETQ